MGGLIDSVLAELQQNKPAGRATNRPGQPVFVFVSQNRRSTGRLLGQSINPQPYGVADGAGAVVALAFEAFFGDFLAAFFLGDFFGAAFLAAFFLVDFFGAAFLAAFFLVAISCGSFRVSARDIPLVYPLGAK